jgi:hypothetical protein
VHSYEFLTAPPKSRRQSLRLSVSGEKIHDALQEVATVVEGDALERWSFPLRALSAKSSSVLGERSA